MADVQHDCRFDEVEILDDDEQGNLKAGMKVLVPCSCGETPLDAMQFGDARAQELQDALLAYKPHMILYHWAPIARRKQILRYGLRPGMRPTTASEGMGGPCICFADSPSWAWALSAEMDWTPDGEWDLWQTTIDRLTEPLVLASDSRMSGVYEVRTESRVYKRDLWFVGTRTV